MMGMSHLISEFYPNPEMPSTYLKMKDVPSKAAFCKHGTTRGMSIRFRCFSSSLDTVPIAPTTIGTTTALTSQSFSISICRSWYFVIFSLLFGTDILISWYCKIDKNAFFFFLYLQQQCQASDVPAPYQFVL